MFNLNDRSEDTMRNTYRTEEIGKRGKTTKKIFSAATAVFLCFGVTTSVLAQTAFEGSLNSVSISDAAGANSPPVANFTYDKVGDSFSFDASGSADSDGSIVEYKWDFGNGTKAIGISASCNFQTYGSFPVTLTVLDNGGGVALAQVNVQNNLAVDTLYTSGTNYNYSSMQSSNNAYVSGSFLTDAPYIVTEIDMPVYKFGNPKGELAMELWTDNSGSPGTLIAATTTIKSAASLTGSTTSRVIETFSFNNVPLSTKTRYHVVMHSTDSNGDGNYVGVTRTSFLSGEFNKKSVDGTNWLSISGNQSLHFIVKGN